MKIIANFNSGKRFILEAKEFSSIEDYLLNNIYDLDSFDILNEDTLRLKKDNIELKKAQEKIYSELNETARNISSAVNKTINYYTNEVFLKRYDRILNELQHIIDNTNINYVIDTVDSIISSNMTEEEKIDQIKIELRAYDTKLSREIINKINSDTTIENIVNLLNKHSKSDLNKKLSNYISDNFKENKPKFISEILSLLKNNYSDSELAKLASKVIGRYKTYYSMIPETQNKNIFLGSNIDYGNGIISFMFRAKKKESKILDYIKNTIIHACPNDFKCEELEPTGKEFALFNAGNDVYNNDGTIFDKGSYENLYMEVSKEVPQEAKMDPRTAKQLAYDNTIHDNDESIENSEELMNRVKRILSSELDNFHIKRNPVKGIKDLEIIEKNKPVLQKTKDGIYIIKIVYSVPNKEDLDSIVTKLYKFYSNLSQSYLNNELHWLNIKDSYNPVNKELTCILWAGEHQGNDIGEI